MFKKLNNSIVRSLDLDFEQCVSNDCNSIVFRFYNPDTFTELLSVGYKQGHGGIIFDSCSDLVDSLYTLVTTLQQINKKTWDTNVSFLKDIRNIAKHLDKGTIANSEIGEILKCNLLFLDSASRIRAESLIKEILEKEDTQGG